MDTGTIVGEQETIDIAPTWAAIMPVLIDILASKTSSQQAKDEVAEEIMCLARNVDKVIQEKKGE